MHLPLIQHHQVHLSYSRFSHSHQVFLSAISTQDEAKTFSQAQTDLNWSQAQTDLNWSQAQTDPNWSQAMDIELVALQNNNYLIPNVTHSW